jgi:tRNA uridine 5-carboxymethylaminomethyl modification enzyme
LVDDGRWAAFSRKCDLVSRETTRLASTRVKVDDGDRKTRSLLDLLRRPGSSYDGLAVLAPDAHVSRETLRMEAGRRVADQAIEQIETATRYAGYVEKQQVDVQRSARADSTLIPPGLDFAAIPALSFEARQVLASRRPATVGAAARLPGITPATVSLLLVHVKQHRAAPAAHPEATGAGA